MINDIARIIKKVFNKSLSTGSIIMFITKYFLAMLAIFAILYILVHKKENNKQIEGNSSHNNGGDDEKDREGMTNLTPADYPSELNKSIINAKKELELIKQAQQENNCRPVMNCRRVGYYCSAIN